MQEIQFVQQHFISLLYSDTAKNTFSQQGYFTNQQSLIQNIQFSQEISQYCQEYSFFSFHSSPDIQHSLSLTQKSYTLDAPDIYHTHLYLSQWVSLKNLEIPKEQFPLLYNFIHDIFTQNTLLSYWNNSFTTDGKISDNASSELMRIRNLKKNIRKQIEKILSSHIKSNEDLAEQRIAFREDRYVLPLKSVAKNRHQGIVHGFSSSGTVTYLEPQEIIPLNNELLSVDDLEHQEITRLLNIWSKKIAENLHDILLIIQRSALLEIGFIKHQFAYQIKANYGTINTNNEIYLKKVYNPFLLLHKNQKSVVPITIELESQYSGLIISGPNAGGKSAALKTLAICIDMFLKGLPIPAQEISLPLFSKLLIEIGDAQNLSNDLSTFSGHIHNIQKILKDMSSSCFIIIDEIAHATDPLEGEALACAIIDKLVELKIPFAITTHYKQVKIKSFEHQNIKSYSAGFNTQTLQPLYTLYPNAIGESYALYIAKKMGLPSNIVDQAQLYLQQHQDKTQKILSNIEQYEKDLRSQELQLIQQQEEHQKLYTELQQQQSALQTEINDLKNKGLQKADKELAYSLRELSHIQKTISQNPKQSGQQLQKIQKIVKQKKQEQTTLSRKKKHTTNIGDTVYIASLDKDAIIEEIHKNKLIVRIGIIKHSVSYDDIFESTKTPTQFITKTQKQYHTEIKTEIDIHGYTVEEAIPLVSKYLDRALSAGLPSFTILHGKGTGVLQKSIKEYLSQQPEVQKFHFADPKNGGSGKTIVFF